MKINLAVYTAQEGYSWQPGTAFSMDDLIGFKKRIGKFPAPDSPDFPFGGVFLLDDRVVFYRYHVAKKIDFRGRDALYCVLGAVSRADAARIDPTALFARPEFAGPMKPFPTELEFQESDPSAVPEWLKNLDKMTLDVRIAGPAEKPNYVVVQKPPESEQPPAPPSGAESPAPVPESGSQPATPASPEEDKQKACSAAQPSGPVPPGSTPPPSSEEKKNPWLRPWMIWTAAAIAAVALTGLVVLWWTWPKGDEPATTENGDPSQEETTGTGVTPAGDSTSAPTNAVPAETNSAPVAVATNQTETVEQPSITNTVSEATAPTNAVQSTTQTNPPPAQVTQPKAGAAQATQPKAGAAQAPKAGAAQAPKAGAAPAKTSTQNTSSPKAPAQTPPKASSSGKNKASTGKKPGPAQSPKKGAKSSGKGR